MIGPTRRWIAGLVLAAVPFVLAALVPGLETLGVIVLLALLALSALDLAFLPRRANYEAALDVAPVLSLAGEEPVTLRLRRLKGPFGRARVRPVLPVEWDVDRPEVTLEVPRSGEATAVFRVRPRKRGRYAPGPVFVRLAAPLGLFWKDLRLDARSEVKVYPAVSSMKRYALLARQLRTREMGLRAHRLRGQGMEFARLRDHHPDDDIRLIDWKATARRSRLIAREYQVERCQNVVLMIDAGRMLTEEVDGIVKIEYVLNAALLLTRIAAQYDDRVGALVFADRVEKNVPLRKGQAAVKGMAEALYDVEPRLRESDYEGAFDVLHTRFRKRSLVVLFTNLVDQETSGLVQGLLRGLARRHLPICVAVGDREVEEAAQRMPSTAEEAYRKAAAAHMLVSRAKTLQELHKSGVHVVDAPAGQVPVAVLDKYLDLKARQLL
jgi:uncharacterized protein (DUF58 family)